MHYRSPEVFSLGGWSPRIPTGFHVPRGTWEHRPGRPCPFAYGAFTLYGGPFQGPSARAELCNSPGPPRLAPPVSRNPGRAIARGPLPSRPVWAPPRSLATTRGMVSFPRGTKMFQFPRFPLPAGRGVSRLSTGTGYPIGASPATLARQLTEAFRSLATPFIGLRRLGIHHVPLNAWPPHHCLHNREGGPWGFLPIRLLRCAGPGPGARPTAPPFLFTAPALPCQGGRGRTPTRTARSKGVGCHSRGR